MQFTEYDIPALSRQLNINFAIQAKKDIQNQLFVQATQTEALQLARNIVPESLIVKLMSISRSYLNRTRKSSVDVYAVALAAGTIIKELDNGNTKHVTNAAIAALMNNLA